MAKAPTSPAGQSADDRIAALEDAVKIMATTLYAPNGGGTDHVEAAAALYASLNPAPVVDAEPEVIADPAPEPVSEPVVEAPADDQVTADPDPAATDPAQA